MTDAYAPVEYFVPCPSGVERFLGEELKALGVRSVRPVRSGVSCQLKLDQAYRVCLWSRLASRVLRIVDRVDAPDADTLYANVKAIAWEEHIGPGKTIATDASGVSQNLRNTQFTGVRVKDAICDRLRDLRGERPDVDPRDPDVLINVSLRNDKAQLAIDFASEALHRRGYRASGVGVEAPMKENLAAAMLTFASWPGLAKEGRVFLDPMCGTGTLAIEAAMMAGDRAPGLLRSKWGFTGWAGHNEEIWNALIDEADERADAGSKDIPLIFAYDASTAAVALARQNIKRAGLSEHIQTGVCEVSALAPKALIERAVAVGLDPDAASRALSGGLVATNPPYGERIGTATALPALYSALGQTLKSGFLGWDVAIITPDPVIDVGLGLLSRDTHTLFNGRIETQVHLYQVSDEESPSVDVGSTQDARQVMVQDAHSEEFMNRLKKNAAHLRKWARREGVSCYRVYDADLPQYNVAIDLYVGAGRSKGKRWLHVFEYAPPKEIDPAKAAMRLSDAIALAPAVLGIDPSDVYLKVRRREKGGSQYAQEHSGRSKKSVIGQIDERGLSFEINLSDYLDTGIFLDQRLTRSMIRGKATDKRFLNLFAYTGTASVFAAAGGAYTTTTVDLSQTYLDWAKRNFELNGFHDVAFGTGEEKANATHELIRADVTTWISSQRRTNHRWDLIFCDPPTFSNSARMHESFDVQRDHAEMLIGLAFLLTPGGELLFSCNRKGFRIDAEALAAVGIEIEDITARTVSPDFARSGGGHVCWRITRPRKEAR